MRAADFTRDLLAIERAIAIGDPGESARLIIRFVDHWYLYQTVVTDPDDREDVERELHSLIRKYRMRYE